MVGTAEKVARVRKVVGDLRDVVRGFILLKVPSSPLLLAADYLEVCAQEMEELAGRQGALEREVRKLSGERVKRGKRKGKKEKKGRRR